MSTNPPNEPLNLENLRERLLRLGLHGLLANVETVIHEPWLPQLLQIEGKRALAAQLPPASESRSATEVQSMADFGMDLADPVRPASRRELFSLNFIEEPANIVLIVERHRQND